MKKGELQEQPTTKTNNLFSVIGQYFKFITDINIDNDNITEDSSMEQLLELPCCWNKIKKGFNNEFNKENKKKKKNEEFLPSLEDCFAFLFKEDTIHSFIEFYNNCNSFFKLFINFIRWR